MNAVLRFKDMEEIKEEKIQEKIPENQERSRDDDGRFRKGFSGNPAGRPRGKTLKEWARQKLMEMDEDERNEFLKGLPKEIIWKMAEGLPQQDITSGGEKINPIPIINLNVSSDHSNKQDTEPDQKDKDNPGRDLGQQNNINPALPNSIIPIGQGKKVNEHSVGELSTSQEGSGEGFSEHNADTPVLP